MWEQRVLVLLNHAWMPGDPAIVAGIIRDWVNALCDLPFEAFDRACTRWLRNSDNVDERGRQMRPTVGHMRDLTLAEVERMAVAVRPRVEAKRPVPTTWPNLQIQIVQDRWKPFPGCDALGLRNEIGSQVGQEIRDLKEAHPNITVIEAFVALTNTVRSEEVGN